MIILALESSAKSASVAISKDRALLAQSYQFSGLTHSCTLLPMAEDMLKNVGLTMADVDCVAVAHGPGSFTGVRIGVSAAKGLCWGGDKPAVGVSTLEAMAWNGECAPEGSIICCAMDARRKQVYNALFTFSNGVPHRLCKDRAVSLEELLEELKNFDCPVYFVGDGAELCYNSFRRILPNSLLAPESVRMQNAWGVCRSAELSEPHPASELLPVYLRLSQAERERLERLNKQKEN